jgi:hypothetical protein
VVHALVFRRSIYANPAALDRARMIPRNAKVAAALSLLLWTSVACCGRGIGYIKLPPRLHFVKEAALTIRHLPLEP